ncbi:hypothetical protein JCM11491_006196 [Sporobolomyces phaffii]
MTVTKRKQKPREVPGVTDAAGANGAGGAAGQGATAASGPTLESGMKASCDSCSADITHSVHVRCAETHPNSDRLTCPDFDLCVDCFLHGKSLGPHRATHAYRVISSHSFPIFTQLWGADEELLLVEGAEMYGLGNWADISEHVGGRTKEECKRHYEQTYLDSPAWPLPVVESDFSPTDVDTFARLKKERLEVLQARPLPLPPPKPLASAPTCHEIAGYMPARLEFEHEFENEAEVLIKDLEFGKVLHFGGEDQPAAAPVASSPPPPPPPLPPTAEGGREDKDGSADQKPTTTDEAATVDGVDEEPEQELELKLSVLEMFNEKYDRRMMAKDLIFDRGLIHYKTLSAVERKRNKDERDLITRSKVFARIQTSRDHEEFVDGLLYEITLRKRIAELQEYRRNGITTLAQASQYDHAKSTRQSAKAASYRDSISLSFDRGARASTGGGGGGGTPLGSNPNGGGGGGNMTPGGAGGITFTSSLTKKHGSSMPPPPLTLATASSLHLLTPLEQELCSTLRMLPRPYLFLKQTLLREYVRIESATGAGRRMTGDEARRAVRRADEDVGREGMGEWGEKVERVWEFLRESAGLHLVAEDPDGGGEGEGEGDATEARARARMDIDGDDRGDGEDDGGEDGSTRGVKMELEV